MDKQAKTCISQNVNGEWNVLFKGQFVRFGQDFSLKHFEDVQTLSTNCECCTVPSTHLHPLFLMLPCSFMPLMSPAVVSSHPRSHSSDYSCCKSPPYSIPWLQTGIHLAIFCSVPSGSTTLGLVPPLIHLLIKPLNFTANSATC